MSNDSAISWITFWVKTSRPGLWFATLWLYLLPTSQIEEIWISLPFWIGLCYVTFPLNLLVYGWNDIVDREIDQFNPRKDSYWFGARGYKYQLDSLWKVITSVHLISFSVLYFIIGPPMVLLMLGLLLVNWLYNLPVYGLRSKPPFELLCQVGYLLVVPLSIYLNDTNHLPWQTYLYLLLFAWQSHLMGEVMDIIPDRESGRKTSATVIGIKGTKLLIILLVALEIGLLLIVFNAVLLAIMLGVGLIWLLIDLFIVFKTQRYTLLQMKLFGLMSNVVAIISMAYVWYSGCLLIVSS